MGALLLTCLATLAQTDATAFPGPIEGGYYLPNGWRITPIGKSIHTEDLILNIQPSPDGKVMIAEHGGYNPHGLVVIDTATDEAVQRIPLVSSWFGLAWRPDGAKLYVSGGNTKKDGNRAPVYEFEYKDGRLSEKPLRNLTETIDPKEIYWAGLAHHPQKDILYAASRTANNVVVFDTASGAIVKRIPTEQTPCDVVISKDGSRLYSSNWSSNSVSVIDTESLEVVSTIGVGDNPSDMLLHPDGRLFVCCANDNTVVVIDTVAGRKTETIVTSMYPNAPEGSTPNSLTLDSEGETLYVANADNYNICVVEVEEAGESDVLGFVPTGWYPSAVAISPDNSKLYIGNAKGNGSYSNIRGPHSPLPEGEEGKGTIKTLMKGSINIVDIPANKGKLRQLTQQAYANCPYNDEMLAMAKPNTGAPSVVPGRVGEGSKIKHVIYVIKENRTYDQVFGDMGKGNGDPRLTIYGRDITPNHHAIAEQFVLLDNLYCDAEVSVDGHQWSNAAYATDYTEKLWPAGYGGHSEAPRAPAMLPGAGYLWDQCARKGLTYRNYGEFAWRQSEGEAMEALDGATSLVGHVAPNYLSWGARDYDNAAEFIKEFDEYEKNYDSTDPSKRLPNLIVMALPEDHTRGTRPGEFTPKASVASNDYGLGMIVDRVSHSKYWPELALFTIQDDAQDGPDHVDARRTVGLVVSPYVKRGTIDSTLYTTSAMLRTIELLLGLQPMSQFDAAANPMYASLGDTPDLTPYTHVKPNIDLEEKNLATAWGAKESSEMDFTIYDRAPMFALNEILWKDAKGADSEMPLPIHRFFYASMANDSAKVAPAK
ncbi:MAG: bifunctional YncE family protein/alkaline phosphatase family protein [Candidatus Hydrogenedentes bacterium]|nr:bifunctional YncE family protein/alkaline phosphatase family protein [Candidatus Hydrogenedentota bacterium]